MFDLLSAGKEELLPKKKPLKLLNLKPERNIASKSNTGLKEVSHVLLKISESTVNLQRDQTRGSKVVM